MSNATINRPLPTIRTNQAIHEHIVYLCEQAEALWRLANPNVDPEEFNWAYLEMYQTLHESMGVTSDSASAFH